jgi:hypothetical protein
MKKYTVKKINNELCWDQISPLSINQYPWYKGGLKQNTEVKIALHEDALHLHVEAEDIHSSAHVLENNGSVYLDSCFEFFFRPENQINDYYINLEINCIGTVYLAVRTEAGKVRALDSQIDEIEVRTSLEKAVIKSVKDSDTSWQLDIRIPMKFVEDFYGRLDKNQWYANFYRCGGSVDDQYATWNPVVTEQPDFHQPRQFGRLLFE